MSDSIFSKIIRGEIPSHKVFEDDKTLAFLDIYSPVEGHTLVIPKRQVEFVWDLSDEDYRSLMETVRKVALRLREVLGVDFVGEKVVGVDVPHAHVHLVPFEEVETFNDSYKSVSDPDHTKLAEVAKRLAF